MASIRFSFPRTGDEPTDRAFDLIASKANELASAVAALGASVSVGAPLTNSVALTGAAAVLPDFTNGVTYATDYASLHATVSQMAARLVALEAVLRAKGVVIS